MASKKFRTEVGEKIRGLRKGCDYSQTDLANLMEIDRSTISKIENGKFSLTLDYLERLSDILNFDLKIEARRKL